MAGGGLSGEPVGVVVDRTNEGCRVLFLGGSTLSNFYAVRFTGRFTGKQVHVYPPITGQVAGWSAVVVRDELMTNTNDAFSTWTRWQLPLDW